MRKKAIKFFALAMALFLAACNGQVAQYPERDDYPAHWDLLRSIIDDAELLAEIEAVIGAPLHLDDDAFIALLPRGNVVVAGETDWSQPLTVFLRPDHTESSANWIFEAYELWVDGMVLVEPFSQRSAGHRLSDADTVTIRIYYEGLGWNGDWYDFLYVEKEVCSENWVEDIIRLAREINGIGVRDIWFEGGVLYVERSPIENYVPWGPAYYRDTLLFLTAASLPGVEYVTLSIAAPGPRFWVWEYADEEFDFITGRTRRVREGHRWAWAGPSAY